MNWFSPVFDLITNCHPDFFDLIKLAFKSLHKGWVKQDITGFNNQLKSLLSGDGRLVSAARGKRVKHICNGANSTNQWDFITLEVVGVSRTVPTFLVR